MRKMSFNHAETSAIAVAALGTLLASGCTRQQPVTMAPPVSQPMGGGGGYAGGGGGMAPQNGQNVFGWQDVPLNQQVTINRAVFDQGGYQLYDNLGDTIAIPFANQNMYVLKFGQSGNGGMYFVNDGTAPTLYVPSGAYLENAAAQGARWYPFSQGFNYTQPVYLGIAPSWNDYVGMGWYPGMSYYGGYWGLHPGMTFSPMAGLYFNIGGHPYYGWNSYHSYYNSNPYNRVYIHSAPSYRYYSAGRGTTGSFGSTRSTFGGSGTRSTGSYSSGRTSSGSFGSGRSTFGSSGSSGSFGSGRTSSGSFGSGRSTFGGGSTFGSGRSTTSGSSGGSFGGGRTSGFGSGRSTFGGGSFGGGSSSSGRSTFGGSSGSFGGSRSTFGGGGRSSGGSFGGGRSSFGGGRRR